MKIVNCFFFAAAVVAFAASAMAANPYGVTDETMGEYEGFWTAKSGAKGRVVAQIRPRSNNQYDGFVLFNRARSPVTAFNLAPAVAEQDGLKFTAASSGQDSGNDLLARSEAKCELKEGKLTGTFSGELGEGTFEAEKVSRKSPTLGEKPPKNAVVLFDGEKATGWENFSWPVKEGAIQVGKGNVQASQELSSFRLRLEFRTPYMPLATGQARGNSGVYLQGKYEVQVLDSFGLYPLQDNDCSGIYRVRAPRMNACLPPMEWQTYDITFLQGARGEAPTVTVSHNGQVVIDQVKVPQSLVESGTGGGVQQKGFLMLQDHGDAVQYRNIWAEPIAAK